MPQMAEVDDELAHVLSLLPAGATATPLDRFASAPNSSDTASAHQHWISQSASCANVVDDADSSRNGPSTKAQS